VVFTVTGVPQVAGQDFGLVRLATLDDYNGVVWEVNPQSGSPSARFLRVGERVPTDVAGEEVALPVEIGALGGVWVPDIGVVSGISWSSPDGRAADQRAAFRLSTASQTAVAPTAGGLQPGDRYTVRGILPGVPTDQALGEQQVDLTLPTRVDVVVPDELSAKASEIVKEQTSVFGQATALNNWFRQHGYYTAGDGTPGTAKLTPGHSAARLAQFLATDAPVGSSEQFAAAMALMARKVGLPARVVMGFRVHGSGTVEVKGRDVDAWVEIPFVDATGTATWVSFDPTPRDRATEPPDEVNKAPRPKYESQDVPPPPIPPPPVDEVAAETGGSKQTEAEKKDNEKRPAAPADRTLLYLAAGVAGVPVFAAGGFATVVLGLKGRRRRKRRSATLVPNRVAGGWSEYVDEARDIGWAVPPRSTRQEIARLLDAAPGAQLAQQADAAVFGPFALTDAEADAYWRQVAQGRRDLRRELGWWRRLRASLSLTSLRKA
jgi:transglutaminase-like putative cysteine protease